MIKPRRSPWPWPGDTQLDRARRIAHTYRQALTNINPTAAAELDTRITALGETWITPQPATHQLDDWITLEEAAEHTGGTPDMIRKWTTRGDNRIPHQRDDRGRIQVRLRDVLDRQAHHRQARAARTT